MASGITTAFWGMTINNYDETDLALVQQAYPDYIRKLVYTREEGAEGTPHIQAWIKLQRQQRLSFVKKLFPRGHFKPLTSDEWTLNTERYAQKQDGTTRSAHTIQLNDPLHTIESVMRKIVKYMKTDDYASEMPDIDLCRAYAEKEFVKEDFRYAKVFVSSTYIQMWKKFGHEILQSIKSEDTHTHTHSDKKFSRGGGITQDGSGCEEDTATQDESDAESGEGYEEGEGDTDEGYDESAGDDASEGTDFSE